MLESATFDLVLGMVFLYLLLSLVVSAVREAIEARLKTRAKFLAHAIEQMLGANTQNLYEHPLIQALYDGGKYDEAAGKFSGHRFFSWLIMLPASFFSQTKMPAYVPSRTFALALLNMVAAKDRKGENDPPPDPLDPARPPADPAVAALPSAAPNLIVQVLAALKGRDDNLSQALVAALSTAGNDVDKGVEAIEKWYDAAMDRVSGWYKRESQHILFWLGLTVAVSLNVDSIFLVKYLASNTQARQNLTKTVNAAASGAGLEKLVAEQRKQQIQEEAAKANLKNPPPAAPAPSNTTADTPEVLMKKIKDADVAVSNSIRSVIDLNLPIGWTRMSLHDFMDGSFGFKNLWTILGWLITAFALSFGAPFWFDIMNKIMVVRSTVKPHEKSPEESSEDRQQK